MNLKEKKEVYMEGLKESKQGKIQQLFYNLKK